MGRALTMKGIAQTAAELPEVLRWGRACVTLFRPTGGDLQAANALFNMAQRAGSATSAAPAGRSMCSAPGRTS